MRAVASRVSTLESRIWSAARPRDRFRLQVRLAGETRCLDGATCKRMLCSNGTLMEVVRFHKRDEGPDDLTDEQLDAWVESFPVEVLSN